MPDTLAVSRCAGIMNMQLVGAATPSTAAISGASCAWCMSVRSGESMLHGRLWHALGTVPVRQDGAEHAGDTSGNREMPAPQATSAVRVHSGEPSPWLAWSVILQACRVSCGCPHLCPCSLAVAR